MTISSFTKVFHHTTYPAILPENVELSASSKRVLIVGAGSGIGQATAVAFARANAQAIILCGRHYSTLNQTVAKIEETKPGTGMLTIEMDMKDEKSVEKAFLRVKREVRGLDIVINCAGFTATNTKLQDTETEDFWKSFGVNVKGSYLLSRTFLTTFSPTPDAQKVLVLLCGSPVAPNPELPASDSMSNFAEAKLAERLAAENQDVLRAYALRPGKVDTGATQAGGEALPGPEAPKDTGEWDDADLPAGFMLWLVSHKGTCIPSGKFLLANWDVEELEARADELKADSKLLSLGLDC
ncbi:NAD(P)-binding protein [Corynespora cassiicola Philippines]|uniref:NAD(P)-binding protein n=1 Tax=Corynespora cassiicola Philippines TaxID=1448308 RepID=A0A2T2NEI4_CORCC|nr:NAD(P)-binding protein [Corynespora cassiicola Philippines]